MPNRTSYQKYRKDVELKNKITNGPIKTWAKDTSRHLTEEDIQMANKYVKNAQHHSITELEIKMVGTCWNG
jgi:ribosomal protein S20